MRAIARLVGFALGVLSLGLGSGFLGCGDSSRDRPAAVRDSIAGNAAEPLRTPDLEARYVAVLVPLEAVDVTSKETGGLTAVRVRAGDVVATGDLVAELDLGPIREDLTIARAELRSARALVEQRQVDIDAADRALQIEREMESKGIGVKKHVEQARFALERARKIKDGAAAAVAEQQARIAQLQRRARESTITAPFSGAVALRYRDPGTTVVAGTAIVRLIRVDALWARFAVPPADVVHLTVGDTVEVVIEIMNVTLPATVRHVSPELDSAAQMVFVDAWLEVPEHLRGSLRAGLPAWVLPR